MSGPESEQRINVDLPVDVPQPREDSSRFTIGFFVKWGVVFALLIISVISGLVIAKSTNTLPDVKILETYKPDESTQIFDRDGNLIANVHGDEDRVIVPLKSISPNIKKAIMAIEDNRFYEHNGIDPRGTIRALAANMSADDNVQGGSTLTQQLVKNLFLTPKKSYTRKLAEAILAMRVENHYSKDKILEMYLNQVYFGNLSYGIEKAARRYFKVSSKHLSVAQAALLAGLLKAPEGLSPYLHPEAARRRQLEVLDKMVEFGYIDSRQRQKAVEEEIVLNSRDAKPSKHPYFIAYVLQEVENRYGEDVMRRGGLRVYTTMDDKAQDLAEKALVKGVLANKFHGVKQGAFVAIDPQSAEVLAMVGGVDFKKNQFNAAVQSKRAVGSTFKPFVYLTAIRLGKITTKTPISDRPVRYGNWSPHNWDGKYMGAMDIRRALTLSRNTTTVQVGMKVGIEEVIKTCQSAGIISTIDDNSSSLLGSSGVSPLELVSAYGTFARGGVYIQSTAIRRVEDNRGNVVKIDTPSPKRVFAENDVAALVDILIDVVEKGTGKNAILKNRAVAGKTGTTDQNRDVWFMGFTPDLVAGVWLGDPKNVPMHQIYGTDAAKVWHDFAEPYFEYRKTPPQDFFVADSDYAARMGLIHLVDRDGMNEAKKKLAVEKLDKYEGSFERRAAARSRAQVKQEKTSPDAVGTPVLDTPAKENTAPLPTAARTAPARETNTSPSRVVRPIPPAKNGAGDVPAPPTPLLETPSQKKDKYEKWDKTLNKVQDNLQ